MQVIVKNEKSHSKKSRIKQIGQGLKGNQKIVQGLKLFRTQNYQQTVHIKEQNRQQHRYLNKKCSLF